MVAHLPIPLEGIGPHQGVKVTDAAAPVGEVDVVLWSAGSQRFLPRGGGQLLRSTAWAAASRCGAGLETGEGEPPSAGVAPCEFVPTVPFVGAVGPRRRPRRRRNFRGGCSPFFVGGAPPSAAPPPFLAAATPTGTPTRPHPPLRP